MGFLGNLFDKMLDSMDKDPTLKWNVLLKNDGVIKVRGIWKSKEIFINDKPLEIEKAVDAVGIDQNKLSISWGEKERADQFLAFAILFQFMSIDDAEKYIDKFCEDFVSRLPKEDFNTEFGLLHWYNNKSGAYKKGKLKSDRYGSAE